MALDMNSGGGCAGLIGHMLYFSMPVPKRYWRRHRNTDPDQACVLAERCSPSAPNAKHYFPPHIFSIRMPPEFTSATVSSLSRVCWDSSGVCHDGGQMIMV